MEDQDMATTEQIATTVAAQTMNIDQSQDQAQQQPP